ncbi:MAG TPA: permease prefix domain 1-containing protein [Gemmatimonadaceae bacterium]|nr:permease prefix domain 1-containing protein [Gemmatimonadaceae bacterium]
MRRGWQRLLGALSLLRRDADLADELELHVQMLTDENIRRGMTPEEARRQARIRFGNVEHMKERYQDQRRKIIARPSAMKWRDYARPVTLFAERSPANFSGWVIAKIFRKWRARLVSNQRPSA